MNPKRVRHLKVEEDKKGPVIYWMQRDKRADDNWALLYAQKSSLERKEPLIVVFNLVPEYLEATIRQYGFLLKGLEETEKKLEKMNIPLVLTLGNPVENIPRIINKYNASELITDFAPLKIVRKWRDEIRDNINISFSEVDTHNIIPCFYLSDKEEFAAYAIRPKIQKQLDEFLVEIPPLKKMPDNDFKHSPVNWDKARKSLKINFDVPEIEWLKPGESEAVKVMEDFLANKLPGYAEFRNDPMKNYQSNLSPYLHFGQISAQRIALETKKIGSHKESVDSFLEELIVRKELADNYCYYNPNYDSTAGFRDWGKKTLDAHRGDERNYIYSLEQFENAETHEDFWNAAQTEMVKTGKLHGYMRMYWAKKILEWTKTPEEAMEYAIYLNDKYELDGRDPNGYTGIAWSIGGIHDRAWSDRPVYGKIRYMNYNGAKRKFNVREYINSRLTEDFFSI